MYIKVLVSFFIVLLLKLNGERNIRYLRKICSIKGIYFRKNGWRIYRIEDI